MVEISVSLEGNIQALPSPPLLPNGIWIEFASSPKLTSVYRAAFEARGYKLAESLEGASAHVIFQAGMQFVRPREKAQKVNVGALFNSVKMNEELEAAKQTANEDRGATLRTFNISNAMLSSVNWWAGATVVGGLLDVAGVRAGFNRALTGDTRGVCLFNCDKWNKYAQDMVVKVTAETPVITTVGYVSTKTVDENLRPQELFDRAMAEVAARMFLPVVTSETK
jgi:hypothetical protein